MVCIKNMNRKIIKIIILHTTLNFTILILFTQSFNFYDNMPMVENFYDYMTYGFLALEYLICCSTLFYFEKSYILLKFSNIQHVQCYYTKCILLITLFYTILNYLPQLAALIKYNAFTPIYIISIVQKFLAYFVLGEIPLILFFKGIKFRTMKICVAYILTVLLFPDMYSMFAFHVSGDIADCLKLIIILLFLNIYLVNCKKGDFICE